MDAVQKAQALTPHELDSPGTFLRVDAATRNVLPSWHELWQYREMLYFLVWRDIKVRYKQMLLGAAWAIIQPVITMVVFTVVFWNVAKIPSNGIPYPLFSFAALVPWTFFSNGVALAVQSLVVQAHLLKKIYFPRPDLPFSPLLPSLTYHFLPL